MLIVCHLGSSTVQTILKLRRQTSETTSAVGRVYQHASSKTIIKRSLLSTANMQERIKAWKLPVAKACVSLPSKSVAFCFALGTSKQCLPGGCTPYVLRSGTGGMRGSMVTRLRPCRYDVDYPHRPPPPTTLRTRATSLVALSYTGTSWSILL